MSKSDKCRFEIVHWKTKQPKANEQVNMQRRFIKKVTILIPPIHPLFSPSADAQKQERIEQMIADINKYKKLDKELTTLRQKHADLEKNLTERITEMTNQRDQLKEKVHEYEQSNRKNTEASNEP